jgi:carbonic anhydrase
MSLKTDSGKEWKVLVLLCASALLATPVSRAQWRTPWEYEGARGAEHWSELDPDYAACNAGKEQSPIDIQHAVRADLPDLRFEYKSGPLRYLVNNGHTIRVNYHDTPSSGNSLVVGGKRYQLMQFHFHRPSEERVSGKAYDMVVHLMHTASDGTVAGVAVFLTAGRANTTIQRVWEHMPKTEGKVGVDFSHEELAIDGVEIDPAGLLPRSPAHYFTYMGSVTAPPCTEHVEWFVLKGPVEISPQQIKAFAELYPNDARPVQALDGRIVKESR